MRYFRLFVFSILFLIPNLSSASLVINEIAWQGYLGDANNEWIELYNNSSEDVTLDGWILEASDGTPSINLSGISISANDFILLERTDDTTVPEETASLFYSGALSNTGESLVLKNSSGTVVDSANFSSGWGDMESTSEGTLSRFDSSWEEGVATPKEENIRLENSDSEDNEDEESDNENEDNGDENTEDEKEKTDIVYKDPKGTIEATNQSFVGIPVVFESFLRDIDGDEIRKGIYVWNMGDGSVFYKTKKEKFTYTYQHEGEYIVTLSFNKLDFGKDIHELEPYIYDEHTLSIIQNSITIEEFKIDGTVILKNNSSSNINLTDWKISNQNSTFEIPKNTFVRGGKTITFPGTITKLSYVPISIINPAGSFVDSSEQKHEDIVLASQEDIQKNSTFSILEPTQQVYASQGELVSSEERNIASVFSFSQQKTMYISLLILLIVLVGIIVWLLFTAQDKKDTDEVSEYRIIEE